MLAKIEGSLKNYFRFSHPICTPASSRPQSRNPQRRPGYASGFAQSPRPGSYFCASPKWLQENGFTLIELIVVIAIIGILAAVAMPNMQRAPKKAKEAVLKEDLYQMRSSIDQYLGDHGEYPSSLQALVDDGYLRFMPIDPVTKSSTSWIEIPVDEETDEDLQPTDDQSTGGPGIMDVKSGALGNSLDGTPYAEW